MPIPTIFLLNNDGGIVEMNDQPYDSERILQELLARCPSVLAGDQMNRSAPVKWLFVSREAGIPGEENGADRFSLDHVFIDQNGIPTLVEVKRSSDTRIRREVVGQMLDYAANAVKYWPLETIRERLEDTCRAANKEPDKAVAEFIGVSGGLDEENSISRFWETVETNLRAGKVRLIFAADAVPPELRRVVEFLNEQMNPAEVLAVEIRQYVGTGVRTLVPNVIRSSKRATTLSTGRTATRWDRTSFINDLHKRRGVEDVAVAEQILAWASTSGVKVWWGQGKVDGSANIGLPHDETIYPLFYMWTYGRIQFQFQTLQHSVSTQLLDGLRLEVNSILGIDIPGEALNKFPSFEISRLKTPELLAQFLRAIEKFAGQIEAIAKSELVTS
jgi:hypothetical protein